jgi:phosphoribosylaminoimidazole-succinocarboxamide synthase
MEPKTLMYSEVRGMTMLRRGKVRDVYDAGPDRLLIVACDRISAFDSVMPTPVPEKGMILTALSNFWFKKTEGIIKNHMIDADPAGLDPVLKGRSVLVKKTKPLVIEAIVRGYITGSGLKEYNKSGTVCGIKLPAGLVESQKLPEPIFTPSTKAESGHDENIPFEQAAALVGNDIAEKVKKASLALYCFAAEYALKRNIIIADTKFEFGIDDSGELILIDEILTPDSSRFWPADVYAPGRSQPSYDKQYLRDWLESAQWNKEPPAPELPAGVVEKTRLKYREALDKITGK